MQSEQTVNRMRGAARNEQGRGRDTVLYNATLVKSCLRLPCIQYSAQLMAMYAGGCPVCQHYLYLFDTFTPSRHPYTAMARPCSKLYIERERLTLECRNVSIRLSAVTLARREPTPSHQLPHTCLETRHMESWTALDSGNLHLSCQTLAHPLSLSSAVT